MSQHMKEQHGVNILKVENEVTEFREQSEKIVPEI